MTISGSAIEDTMWMFERVSDEEGLRLITAFLQITNADVRRALIEAAEAAVPAESPTVIRSNFIEQDNCPPEPVNR